MARPRREPPPVEPPVEPPEVNPGAVDPGEEGDGYERTYRRPDLRDRLRDQPLPEDFGGGDIEGVWLYEMAELAGLGRAEVNALKSFLSNRVDKYRPAYGRNDVRRPRQLVFIGTTYDIEFLHDTTGSRRFWPVLQARKGAPCDVDRIKRDRDQF